ncbi:hypothetical protein E2C01_064917 [Portunus trituberculatus]|uniref:Uncharacterized protein n=1 Tax=Portunus trituberculatus TaxID=210409 RepID=A0A5B7HHH1_PORTR|nr:hypothetical protein [Portunus trituberculatus]
MDTSSSDDLNTSLESNFSEEADILALRRSERPSPFTLRSQCSNHRCPQGAGILFRSRISPSPSKHTTPIIHMFSMIPKENNDLRASLYY